MSSTQVRLHPITKELLDAKKAKINKAREKAKKKPLTMDDIVALAVENLPIDIGVGK